MKKFIIILLTFLTFQAFGQEDPNELVKPIIEEGTRLYQCEMASWYGTDLFLANYENRASIGGYFSYMDEETPKCVFVSGGEIPNVIGTISFDSTYSTKTAIINLEERALTKTESDLFTLRENALEVVQSDTLFKVYEGTNLNLIPFIYNGVKKVYILTGPQNNGVVIFGNDYLILFDDDNQVVEKKQLHNNIIPIYYGQHEGEGKEEVSSMHSHSEETGDLITVTDVCTLLLYGKYTTWGQHNIVSEKYLSMWDIKEKTMFVMTMEAVRKIDEHQAELKKEREAEKGKKKKKKKKKRK